jgi:hypothetical protein
MNRNNNSSRRGSSAAKKTRKATDTSIPGPGYKVTKASLNKGIESSRLKLYDHAAAQIHRYLDPEHASDKTLTTYSTSSVGTQLYRPKFVKNVNTDDDGNFTILTFPTFRRPVWMTDYSLTPVNSQFRGYCNFERYGFVESNSLSPMGLNVNSGLSQTSLGPVVKGITLVGANPTEMFNSYFNDDGHWWYDIDVEASGNGVFQLDIILDFDVENPNPGTIEDLTFIPGSGIVSTTSFGVGTSIGGGRLLFSAVITIATGNVLVSIRMPNWISRQETYDRAVVHMYVDFPLARGSKSILHAVESNLADQIDTSAQRYVNLGMMTWLEFQGSTLENGGQITGYRFPKGTQFLNTSFSNRYDYVSQNPRAYVGPLKHGTVGYWLPEDLDQCNFDRLYNSEVGNFSVIQGKREVAQTLTLHFSSAVLVTTFSQAYPGKHIMQSPEVFAILLSILKEMPPMIENAKHKALVAKAVNYLSAHRSQIANGVMDVVDVVKKLAPIIGTLMAAA